MNARWIAIAGISFSSWFSVVGCLSSDASGDSERDTADPIPNQPPAGCRKTLCDYVRASCVDPRSLCDKCWSVCEHGSIDDLESCIAGCTDVCNITTPHSRCDADLADCRSTSKNGICADDHGLRR